MNRQWKAGWPLLLGLWVWAVCAAAPQSRHADIEAAGLSGRLVITGAETMAPLVSAIAQRFQGLHPEARIEVRAASSNLGLADVMQGKSDIAMVSRVLDDAKAHELRGLPIARDAVAIVVHRDNPVRELGDRQIRDIFTGKTTNWAQVGGRDEAILTAAPDPARSSYDLFTRYFGIAAGELKAQRSLGSSADRIKLVTDHPNALVCMSVGDAERQMQAGAPIRLLPTAGLAASSRNIRKGDFPLSRPLTLVTRGMPSGLSKAFIEYALSSQVTDIVVAHDFVPYLD